MLTDCFVMDLTGKKKIAAKSKYDWKRLILMPSHKMLTAVTEFVKK